MSATVLRWLQGTPLSMVAAAFDLDPLAHAEPDRGVRLANTTETISTETISTETISTETISTARADVGVVDGPAATVAYAVLANRTDTDRRDAVLADMRSIGRAIRAHIGA